MSNIQTLAKRVVSLGQKRFNEGDQASYANLADVYAFLKEYASKGKNQKWKRFLGAVEQQINAVEQQFDNGVMQYARQLSESEKTLAVGLAHSYKG
ncbi:MAG: hypothetical protein CL489_08985 [Acidobacteria bacterium]|nr:hypothetical protein [Acidobacteriota bacterium]|tara:strand:- start:33896 stop:34183 length:288 start_codon:yes stop_codon:yes gene_type:complete